MATRKICMIGAFATGKTSLISRFVHSVFSEKYLTTVGVKIDTKLVEFAPGESVKLVIWDVAGSSALSTIEQRYLRGSAGYILVVDGTRKNTLDVALELDEKARGLLGELPRLLVFNKNDLMPEWEVTSGDVEAASKKLPVRLCSALSGDGVEDAFKDIAHAIMTDDK